MRKITFEGENMLIRYRVSNFLSFNEMQEFSMIAGKTRNHQNRVLTDESTGLKLLKFGSVFGANGSGKSNLIKAIDFSIQIACRGINAAAQTENYFKLDEKNKTKPSYFEFEMKIEDKYYAYGFELILSNKEFAAEWLYEIGKKDSKMIFERNITEGTINLTAIKNKTLKNKFEVYGDDIRNNKNLLFLKDIHSRGNLLDKEYENEEIIKIIRKVYDWINQKLVVVRPSAAPFPRSYYDHLVAEDDDPFFRTSDPQKIIELIKLFGTGITDYKVEKKTLEESELPIQEKMKIKNIVKEDRERTKLEKGNSMKINYLAIMQPHTATNSKYSIHAHTVKEGVAVPIDDPITAKTLLFKHGTGYLNFMDESDGTKRLLDLITILIYENKNRVYIIDEVDRSLHPQLTRKFIDLFLKYAIDKNIQFIITTHESRLLDLDLLRRDEIWFVDKNESGESSLYSLDEYSERFDKKIDKAYLEGRYGGVPIFEEMFPNMGENDES